MRGGVHSDLSRTTGLKKEKSPAGLALTQGGEGNTFIRDINKKPTDMLLTNRARQKKGNTIAFTVVLILILALVLWIFLM